jgi:2-methylcitrate dehydratase PrpD
VASAILALAEVTNASGRDLIDALVLGVDVECRIGNCMYPDHYLRGWHITGSVGPLGAAAACARMLGLDELQASWAIGIAASQPIGVREQFGTMTKPFHPGGAARAGLTSALLAKNGFTASPKALEAPRGYCHVVSTKNDWSEITGELGRRFEISFNTYKPFACGIVIHPIIDGASQLRAQGMKAGDVERVELRVHPLVVELTGKKEPQDGLQGKFSFYHGFAAGLIAGRAGEGEYSDAFVTREDVVALRRKVNATVDKSIAEDAVDITVTLKGGKQQHLRVDHAIGSLERPLSDMDLEAKFHSLVDPVLGARKAGALVKECWNIGQATDVKALVAAARP